MWWGCLHYFKLLLQVPYTLETVTVAILTVVILTVLILTLLILTVLILTVVTSVVTVTVVTKGSRKKTAAATQQLGSSAGKKTEAAAQLNREQILSHLN